MVITGFLNTAFKVVNAVIYQNLGFVPSVSSDKKYIDKTSIKNEDKIQVDQKIVTIGEFTFGVSS